MMMSNQSLETLSYNTEKLTMTNKPTTRSIYILYTECVDQTVSFKSYFSFLVIHIAWNTEEPSSLCHTEQKESTSTYTIQSSYLSRSWGGRFSGD